MTSPGDFVVGCNYWASHAGAAMWRDWQPEVVARDLERLAKVGLQVLRVFPLWPDFQPLTQLGTGFGPVEFRHDEEALPDDDAGRAGVSAIALQRFRVLADLAAQHGLHLIVGLITGWMSGRLFTPPAFVGRNALTDPLVLMWQTRFVRYFVRCFRDHPAILAWDLGNECNCMGPATREQAWAWTSAITNAIRVEDSTRPIVSGMHSLSPAPTGTWRIQDQGELTDVLTTHPYPYFTPYCDQDPVNTMRTILHATAESRLYADIGGKPCLVEEIGTLGPMVADERTAADFIRAALFSSWAHDCHGLLWWCAFDFGHLSQAPYDWDAYERELGLFRADGTPRPVLDELSQFVQLLSELPIRKLPPRRIDGVCILSEGQDQWAVAYSTFVLAKQAGFDIRFQYADQPIQDAALYLLPSVSGGRILYRRRWLELLERVRAGATLYVSHEDGMLSPFTAPFGVEVLTRARRDGAASIRFDGVAGHPLFTTRAPIDLRLKPARADVTVLGRTEDGNPAFIHTPYGRGALYFLSAPIERELTHTAGSFHLPNAPACWQVYRHIAQPVLASRIATKHHPHVGLTEHTLEDNRRALVVINYSPHPISTRLSLADGWRISEVWRGALAGLRAAEIDIHLPANEACILVASPSATRHPSPDRT
ncbi:MAG: beta-mannanase [Anaerolineae bacterium]|nr:hypothetical protein [Thermoflexales bacterium]MDW8407823.1 beta-mannanase [Anaerolineae bacterium]